jgi:phosphate transport system protein
MTQTNDHELALLKEKLLRMAGCAEQAANRAVKALLKRDDDLALQVKGDDSVVDGLQMEIDELAIRILARTRAVESLRLVTVAMRIAAELERVGDEATTIARRVGELNKEQPLRQCAAIPPMAALALALLKEALDAFVNPDSARARQVIARDEEVDRQNGRLRDDLAAHMRAKPNAINSCLHLMVIAKCLERVADHAKNVAESVVYLHEGHDIRHTRKRLAMRP